MSVGKPSVIRDSPCRQCGEMGTESITAAEVRNTYLHEWLECGHSVKVTTDLPPVPIVRYLNRY